MSTYFNRLRRSYRPRPGGFTLIELMVVSSIMLLITTFILFRQEGFNSSTLLRSLAYSVALSVRQAQVYGVSVRESSSGTGIFAPGFGVYFANGGDADYNHYLMFADANGDGWYDSTEKLPGFTIGRGNGGDYTIKNFCAHVSGGLDECSASGDITSLVIYFRRPNPDACFTTNAYPGVCALGAALRYDYAYVQVRSAAGNDTRTVKVSSTGQISVCTLNADPSTC